MDKGRIITIFLSLLIVIALSLASFVYVKMQYETVAAAGYMNGSMPEGDMMKLSCYDSDGGKVFYSKGHSKGYAPSGDFAEFDDSCEGTVLSEGFCDKRMLSMVYYACSYGCSDGECEG